MRVLKMTLSHNVYFAALFVVSAAILLNFIISPAYAVDDISVRDAYAAQQSGQMIIVDVREPNEWKQTGIIPDAKTIAMRDPNFLKKIATLIDANPEKTIGLICAAGGRSTYLGREMIKRGMTNVVDIKAGMRGSFGRKGWIASGLPTTSWKP